MLGATQAAKESLKTMANISEALQFDMQANNARLDVLKEWREKKLNGCIDYGDVTYHLVDGIPAPFPKSDYDIALEELNKEFPGADCETAPPAEIKKYSSDGLTEPTILFILGLAVLVANFVF